MRLLKDHAASQLGIASMRRRLPRANVGPPDLADRHK